MCYLAGSQSRRKLESLRDQSSYKWNRFLAHFLRRQSTTGTDFFHFLTLAGNIEPKSAGTLHGWRYFSPVSLSHFTLVRTDFDEWRVGCGKQSQATRDIGPEWAWASSHLSQSTCHAASHITLGAIMCTWRRVSVSDHFVITWHWNWLHKNRQIRTKRYFYTSLPRSMCRNQVDYICSTTN